MKSQRAELVAEAAVTLLVERGMRGLTHRAVDEAAGLPPGSTSNLARTRSALLELTLARLTELETRHFSAVLESGAARAGNGTAGAGGGADQEEDSGLKTLAELMAQALWTQLTAGRRLTVARYELALEATRRPELRAIYDRAGVRFREPAVAALAAAGSRDPVRHGRQLVAFGEGLMFDAVAGAGAEPTLDDIRLGVRELLRGMLPEPGAEV
ncbi:TetR/AcrR family transcriptional regulator [Planobispora takensis]|uniref:TetR family transcriptional regulator n=1 Tax=Planobispora takensis TaxID=1367882 RepID=A0A8J3WT05_9ACTN|nr:TetR/AcrR family transcriptional regulator [Planobispora takensis]GII00850.1 TetR family transcriptional regulator [Planobispora takensis]